MRSAIRAAPALVFAALPPMILAIVMAAATPAQAAPMACSAPAEAMVDLRLPHLGAPAVWDAQYAPRGQSIDFISAVPEADGTAMAIGRMTVPGKSDTSMLFVRLDRRGRAVSTVSTPGAPGQLPLAALRLGTGFLVLANDGDPSAGGHARLAWYDADGHFLREMDLGAGTTATGLVAAPGGFAVALALTDRRKGTAAHAALARFTADGGKSWQRSFASGVDSMIEGVSTAGDGFVATGAMRLDDGRLGGWVMRISGNGAVIWQQVLPRGGGAVLQHATVRKAADGGEIVFVVGAVTPSGGGAAHALWLAAFDGGGALRWQRYLRRPDYALAAVAVAAGGDPGDGGALLVAANAKALTPGGDRDHIRLLTFTPHGMLTEDQAFLDGAGASLSDLATRGDGTLLLAATVIADDTPLGFKVTGTGGIVTDPAKAPAATAMHKGWIIVASTPEPTPDPCGP